MTTPCVLVYTNENKEITSALSREGLEVVAVTSLGELSQAARHRRFHLLVIDSLISPPATQLRDVLSSLWLGPSGGLSLTKEKVAELVPPALIIMPPSDAYSLIQEQMLKGIVERDELLFRPYRYSELTLRVKAMLIRAGLESTGSYPVPPVEAAKPKGRVIAVFSAKGGNGKTMLACNLAVALKQQMKPNETLCLFDGNLQFGDVRVALDIQIPHNIFETGAFETGVLEAEAIKQVAYLHPSGVRVLSSPTQSYTAEKVTTTTLQQLFVLLRDLASLVIVDLPTSYEEKTLTMLEIADEVLVVVTPEVSTVAHTTAFLEMATKLDLDRKISIVVNRSDSFSGVPPTLLKQTFENRIIGQVVSDGRMITRALNAGQPFVLSQPKSQAARDIIALAKILWQRHQARQQSVEKAPKLLSAGEESKRVKPHKFRLFRLVANSQ
jgi:pilus assembly protein CpaE